MESKLALMPFSLKQIKANNKAKGMMIATVKVVRQSAINKNTITVTSTIPSIKLWITVCVAKSIKVVRS